MTVRWWARTSAALAPVALIGGWTWAAARRPGFDSTHDTISALAAQGADERWIMTSGLAVLGVCHAVTASGLSDARPAGRIVFALGGVATLAVAALPQPLAGHETAAAVGFASLAVWPVLSGLPGSRAAAAVLLGAVGWFGIELGRGGLVGLSERVAAGAEALWPLVAVLVATGRGTARSGTTR